MRKFSLEEAEAESDNEDWEDGNHQQEEQYETISNENVIEIQLDNTPIVEKKKRKRSQMRTSEERKIQQEDKKEELRNLLHRSLILASNCYKEDIKVICLSILPNELMNIAASTIEFLQIFGTWFRNNFEVIDFKDMTVEEGRDGSTSSDLINCIRNCAGSVHQLCQIAIAMLTTLNITTRYAVTLDLSSRTSSDIVPCAWIEVLTFSPRDKYEKWYCVEFFRNIISTNKIIIEQECRSRKSCLSYAIAIDQNGVVYDITFQYAANPVRTRSKRLNDEKWWVKLLNEFSDKDSRNITSNHCDILKVLPTSISGFRDHPYYALAIPDHLGKRRILHPDAKPVGLFSGIPVYLRSDICELKTLVQWKKLNRVLLPNQSPHLVVETGSTESSITHELYAEHQTIERQIPQVQVDTSGQKVIPTNKHGNIEVWDGKKEYIPHGCAYLSSSFALKAAQQLGIHHAPALIGFKSIGVMKYSPLIQGVVVLEEDVDLITEASLLLENQLEEEEKEKKYQKIVKKWIHLTRSLISRVELYEEYGH